MIKPRFSIFKNNFKYRFSRRRISLRNSTLIEIVLLTLSKTINSNVIKKTLSSILILRIDYIEFLLKNLIKNKYYIRDSISVATQT